MNLRTKIINAITDFLRENYEGEIAIHDEISTEELTPPCCVVRISSAEDMGNGQFQMLDCNVLIGVFHDHAMTGATTAEENSAELFATFADPDEVISHTLTKGVAASCFHYMQSEMSISDQGWQNVAAYRCIASSTS